jgi:hypothetical protein
MNKVVFVLIFCIHLLLSACALTSSQKKSGLIQFYDQDIENFWTAFSLTQDMPIDDCAKEFKKLYFGG